MRLSPVVVALLMVLATGPALAGGAAAQPTSIDGAQPTLASAQDDLDCEFPVEVEDATGETVTVKEEPERVVVLAPSAAQHLWEIGAEEKVVGMPVNQYTEYLEGSEEREHVLTESDQGFDMPDNEKIVDLDPDLVLSPNVIPEDAVTELRHDAGLTVYHYPLAGSFEDVMTLVERSGQLVGECESAREVTGEMEERIDLVENAVADEEKPRVFYDMGYGTADNPPYSINDQAFEHEVLETAGAENIAADIDAEYGGAYPQVSTEVILDENPEWIVTPGEQLSEFPGYDETTAMQNDQVIRIDGNYISQHGPRTVDALVAIAEELHPEAMEEARQEQTDGDSDDADEDEDVLQDEDEDADGDEDGDADDEGPGLTVGAAVAALVALALVATRRE